MAETLIAILLVTTSAGGSTLVFRWPEHPAPLPRLSRPRPDETLSLSLLDNPWKAFQYGEELDKPLDLSLHDFSHDPNYAWPRPNALRGRTLSFGQASHHFSGRNSSSGGSYERKDFVLDEYEHVLGYSAAFLAQHLCPQASMCHQKFELVIDDLAFIGHPVCAESDGGWRFKPEKIRTGSRGREARDIDLLTPDAATRNRSSSESQSASKSNWLHAFHLVLVLDLPDPSSSVSGNLSKYFNILYEQIAFTLTAVLYQEQVLSNFVERECDALFTLKESCISKEEPFSKFASQCFEVSSIAPAMRTLYEAIKSSAVAYITINYLPLELQLPPYLDTLLHSQDDQETNFIDPFDDDVTLNWGQDMSLGWKLPTVAPWKTLLLLDVDNDMDPHQILKGPYDMPEDKNLVEGLIRFLETASVTLSLSEMATLLDWDLETQVYPIVKWLVLHRRAKVIDVIHPGLRTVFALPSKFNSPLPQLTREFQDTFSHPSIPPLPQILSMLSMSLSKQTDNHFFASVVKSKVLIPMYHDVVLWMLKRDMLVPLHLRIRIVATRELKLRVKAARDLKAARKQVLGGTLQDPNSVADGTHATTNSKSTLFPRNNGSKFGGRFQRKLLVEAGQSDTSDLTSHKDRGDEDQENRSDISEADDEDSGWCTSEDQLTPSIIYDPGKATPMQRCWLAAMSDGRDPDIARRFALINQYFDGKRSDDEILYRAEISRKQLREVLHHYEEYLQTFLHPS